MANYMTGVIYLEKDDLNPNGTLSENVLKYIGGRPSMLLIHGDFCPHCQVVKKPYEDAAAQLSGKVPFLTVKVDGTEAERALRPALAKIPGYTGGVPFMTAINGNGEAVQIFRGPRDKPTLIEFAEKYCSPPQPL